MARPSLYLTIIRYNVEMDEMCAVLCDEEKICNQDYSELNYMLWRKRNIYVLKLLTFQISWYKNEKRKHANENSCTLTSLYSQPAIWVCMAGTGRYKFGTCGNLVVVYKASLVLALVQTQNFGCVFGLRPSKTKCLITKYLWV